MTQGALTTLLFYVRNQASDRHERPAYDADEMAAQLMFHVKHEAIADLAILLERLTTQNEVMNLVGPATIPHFWSRHVLDSAQLLDCCQMP